MAKGKAPSTTEEPAALTEDTPLPPPAETAAAPTAAPTAEEGAAAPPEEAVEPAAQEEQKPDLDAQLEGLPDDERKELLRKHFPDDLQRLEQSAQDKAWNRLQADQYQQIQANQVLQDTLRNLDTADDDSKRAGHVESYAVWRTQQAAQRQQVENLESVREALGVSREDHDEIMIRVHQAAARDNRQATFGDYVKHVTGDKFMPKQEWTKAMRQEAEAVWAEKHGQTIAQQPAPVSVGPGEPPATQDDERAKAEAVLKDPHAGQEAKTAAYRKLYGEPPRY